MRNPKPTPLLPSELLRTQALSLSYGSESILQTINFSISEGEIVTIVGPNGSGKSSFLRLLIGATQVSSGQLWHRPNLRIGYVPQRLSVESTLPMTVRRFLDLNARGDKQKQHAVLDRVSATSVADAQLTHLSGGQLQRVLLAQALLAEPHLLVLDEATQGLDQLGEAGFYRLIEEVRNEQGCAVLLVSHDLHVVMSASDRVICLNRHICCEGAPTHVSAAPEYRALFGLGTEGALALYRHEHDHDHDEHVCSSHALQPQATVPASKLDTTSDQSETR